MYNSTRRVYDPGKQAVERVRIHSFWGPRNREQKFQHGGDSLFEYVMSFVCKQTKSINPALLINRLLSFGYVHEKLKCCVQTHTSAELKSDFCEYI